LNEISELLLISEKDVKSLLRVSDIVRLVEESFRLHGLRETVVAPSSTITVGEDSRVHAMTAYIKALNLVGVKWGGAFRYNVEKYGLPGHVPMIILTDSTTGVPFAVIGAMWITQVRTGAVTAVGAKYLALKDSRVVGIVGAGAQARGNLEALSHILKIEKVKVTSRRKESCVKFAGEMSEKLGLDVQSLDNADEVVEGSDVVVTATPAQTPFVRDSSAKPGILVVTLGSHQEVDDIFPRRADKIIVDSIGTHTSGGFADLLRKGVVSEKDIYATLGEIVAGKKAGRELPEERILFSHAGMAIHDLIVGHEAYKRGLKRGFGERKKLF